MTRDERFDEDEWALLVALPRHVAVRRTRRAWRSPTPTRVAPPRR
jgi:hypothetical protein